MRKRREQATNSSLPENIRVHYGADRERTRLEHSAGALERLRTRYVPPLPAVVVDAGGGTGPYAIWLAEQGYTVYLLDVMPLHIERACQDATMHAASLASLTVGDAGQLAFPAGSVDVVLLLGPLYHLTEHQDRLAAWWEAYRIVREGGVILAAGISRYASLLDGLFHGLLDDAAFEHIVHQDLATGQHRNPTNHPSYFATAYFHTPQALQEEAREAGWLVRVLHS